ncbi:MAG: DNA internalization-related competence protein ComEC/Rec2 [Gammaproteobacteria bacterium]
MYDKILSIIAGCVAWAAHYCDHPWLAVALLAAVVVGGAIRRCGVVLLIIFLLSFSYGHWRSARVLGHQLPVADGNGLFWVEATVTRVDSTNSTLGYHDSFILSQAAATSYSGRRRQLLNIKVGSYGGYKPLLLHHCSFYARLRAPVGTRNPGGSNRELYYFINKISAVGYVVEHPDNTCRTDETVARVAKIRANLSSAFDRSEVSSGARAILKAISLGDRSELNLFQRDVFTQTGTAHLLAISGLHISLVAAFAFVVFRTIMLLAFGGRNSLRLYKFSLVASTLVAFVYAALANFAVPTQRAFVVVLMSSISLVFAKSMLSAQTLLWAALIVVMVDPPSVLRLGFWMSFSAVGVLIVMRARRPANSWWRAAFHTHCVLSIASLPLVLTFSDKLPISAPVANFVAVPVMCFLLIPLVLTGVMFSLAGSPFSEVLWRVAASAFDYLWQFLLIVNEYGPALEMPTPLNLPQLMLLAVGVVVLLVPIIPRRWMFIALAVVPGFLPYQSSLEGGEYRLIILDVGQGLAILVATKDHLLVYDTGPAFGNYSAGRAIVGPAIRKLGRRWVDRVILSHGDNDHAGGLEGLADAIEIRGAVIGGERRNQTGAAQCRAGMQWEWDEVAFTVLSPPPEVSGTTNDLSCVLLVSSPFGSALLPGDIEADTEARLVEQGSNLVDVNILIAPHHGSATSSTSNFVSAVSPQYVVFAAGFHNRFAFPHPQPVSRYEKIGARSFVTGEYGALEFSVRRVGVQVISQRRVPFRQRDDEETKKARVSDAAGKGH